MLVYKWTTPERTTRDGYEYEVGVAAEASGSGDLCGPGWLHAYPTPLLAVMMRPAHVPDEYTVLWQAEASGEIRRQPDKLGCTRLTLQEPVTPPVVTIAQQVRFAILAAREVCQDAAWRVWADAWLSGRDRSAAAAWTAATAVWATAAWAAAEAAASAARAAKSAAAWAAKSTEAAASAADVAAAARAGCLLDLAALAAQAVREEAGHV